MKLPGKNTFRKEPFLSAHSLEVQTIRVGNSQGQRLELTAHLAPTLRKQRHMDSSVWLFFCTSNAAQDLSPCNGTTTFRVGLLSLISLIQIIPHIEAQKLGDSRSYDVENHCQ